MCFILVVKNEFKNNDLSTTSRLMGPRSWLRRYFSQASAYGAGGNSQHGQLSVTTHTVEQPPWLGGNFPNQPRNGSFSNQLRAPLPMAPCPEANGQTIHEWQLPLYTTENNEEGIHAEMDAGVCQFCSTVEEPALVRKMA